MSLDRARLPALRAGRGSLEATAWLGILVLAAILRLPDLAGRGMWDADQGHDMLVLRDLVLDGRVPLLGPPTSIGAFHHGVAYYLFLAPAALVSGADPVVVTTWIAILGVLAVATTGWLARSIAGPIAGIVAGLVLAVSASAVEESTFIWNPNLIALTSSIALAAAWRAHTSGRARWWVVAGAAAVATMHCHVLGVILTPVVAALLLVDWRARRAAGDRAAARRMGWAALAWLAIAITSYIPLVVHELGSDASELRALGAFVAGGGGSSGVPFVMRVPVVLLRVLGWPLAGLLTVAPIATILGAGLVMWIVVWRGWLSRVGPADKETGGGEVLGVRWLGLGLGWTVLALAVAAPSLGAVVPGLPNDHYHAFADPIVVALVAIGVAALLRSGPARPRDPTIIARAAAGLGVVTAVVAFNAASQPPRTAPDGGWQAAQRAAERVLDVAGPQQVALDSLPAFKSTDAIRFPLERLRPGGVVPADHPLATVASGSTRFVVLCDQLFRESIGADCGGPAEDARIVQLLGSSPGAALDRFEAAPGRWVSVYGSGSTG